MNVKLHDIDAYLCKVKDAIKKDNYQIANNSRRKDNKKLFWDYIIDEKMAKEILLELTAYDFSEILQNEHRGYKNEFLYVFGNGHPEFGWIAHDAGLPADGVEFLVDRRCFLQCTGHPPFGSFCQRLRFRDGIIALTRPYAAA